MKNFIGVLVVSLVMLSCEKDNKPTYIEGVGTVSSNSVQAKNSASGMLLPQNQQPVAANPANPQQVQIQPQNAQQQQVVAPGMNPPHGKPGHRCDIAVGAPLNSAANKNVQSVASQQITVNPTNSTPAPSSAKIKTAPGMNPPHGEPNHRCDIAVGEPLNSPPGKAATPINPNTAPTTLVSPKNLPATVAAPANNAPAIGADGKPLAVNPAHGEPGHRCDIAVGAPLK